MNVAARRSLLDVILLGILFEEPMHAYLMQKVIRQRGIDKVVNVRHRASVYQALERLLRLGLIEIREKVETGGQADRIVYAATDLGREIVVARLPQMVETIGVNDLEFPAAVSLFTMLPPDEARKNFELRAQAIRAWLLRLEQEKLRAKESSRLSLLNNEYRSALLEAELMWLRTVIEDLANGSFIWNDRASRNVPAPSPQESDLSSPKAEEGNQDRD